MTTSPGKAAAVEVEAQLARWSIGEATITVVSELDDMRFRRAILQGASDEDWQRAIAGLGDEHVAPDTGDMRMSIHGFLVELPAATVLVDTCFGNEKDRGPTHFGSRLDTPWLERLRMAGAEPGGIHYVVCTHLHCDHVGWNTTLDEGRWRPTFPNARYVFSALECELLQASPDRPGNNGSFADSVVPILEADQALLVDGDLQLCPGIALEVAPGHSPGHLVVLLQAGGRSVRFVGDLIASPAQVYMPEAWLTIDDDPATAARSRAQVLRAATADGGLVATGHARSPYLFHVGQDDVGYQVSWLAPDAARA